MIAWKNSELHASGESESWNLDVYRTDMTCDTYVISGTIKQHGFSNIGFHEVRSSIDSMQTAMKLCESKAYECWNRAVEILQTIGKELM